MKSLKMKLGYQDLVMDKNGKLMVNKVTLEKWLGKELEPEEVQYALKRVFDRYPIHHFKIIEIFPYLNQVCKSIAKLCPKKKEKELKCTNKKIKVASGTHLLKHI